MLRAYISSAIKTVLRRGGMRGISAASAAMLLAAAGADLHAQTGQCVSLDPPCPDPAPLTVAFTNAITTISALPARVYFTVSGTQGNYAAQTANVTATVNGQPAAVGYQFAANYASLSGEVTLTSLGSTNTVTVSYSDGNGAAGSASMSVAYSPPPPPPVRGTPIVQLADSMRRRSIAGCDGCLYGTASYSTPTYRSLDQDRGLTLAYSSEAAAPTVTVALDVNTNSTDSVHSLVLGLRRENSDSIPLTTGGHLVYYTPRRGSNRIVAHFDASGWGSGLHKVTAVVHNNWPGETRTTTIPMTIMVVNESGSRFGSGWTVAGVQKLYMPWGGAGDAMFFDGAGSMVLFRNCGSYCWTAPLGEPSSFVFIGNHRGERRYQDGTVATFDTYQGTLLSVRDRVGNTTAYGYDATNRLASVTDPAGYVTTLSYRHQGDDSQWKKETIGSINLNGRWMYFGVDGSNDLKVLQDPDGQAHFASYDTAHRMSMWQTRMGGSVWFGYDRFGGLAWATTPAVTLAGGSSATPTTTIHSRELAMLPPVGYGSMSQPATPIDSAWIRLIAPSGDTTRLLVNGEGNATHVVARDPHGTLQTTTIKYNAAGQPETVASTDGTAVGYMWTGALLDSVNTGATRTSYQYNTLGQPLYTYVNGALLGTNVYTTDGRSLMERTITGSDTTKFTYDTRGRVLTVRDPEGHQTTYAYQAAGFQNLQSATRNNRTTTFGYDAYGRLRTVTNPLSQTTTTEYDVLDRVTQVTTQDTRVSLWTYDDANRTYTFTDPKGNRYATYTDAGGRVIRQEDPNYQNSYTWYDALGRVSSWQDRDGLIGSIHYDRRGRDSVITAGSVVTWMAYGPSGRWVSYANGEGNDTLHYDGEGRLVKQVTVRGGRVFTQTGTFNPDGHRRELAIAAGHWAQPRTLYWTVDPLLRPRAVFDFGGKGTSITYNKDHLPHVVTVPNGSSSASWFKKTTSYTTNHGAFQESYTHWGGILNRMYGYDPLDRVSELQRGDYTGDSYSARVASYDVMGRLQSYQDEQRWNEPVWVCNGPEINGDCYWEPNWQTNIERQAAYTYDAVGNRTDNGAVIGGANRLTSFGGYTMGYDGEGHLLSKSGNGVSQGFTWNALGQLVSTTRNGVTTTFGYDGLGRRVRKTVNGSTTYYLHDGDNLIMQLDASGNPQLEFSYYPGIDQPHAVRRVSDGAVFYYVTERPGHVTALVNASNQVVNQYSYTPFGEAITVSEQVPQPFRFTGREYDSETGLYYYRARYYDPTLARFISEDPIGLAGGVNLYAYVGNDPVNHTDPTGLCPQGTDLVISLNEDGGWRAECVRNGGRSGGHMLPPVHSTANASTWSFSTPPNQGANVSPSARGADWAGLPLFGPPNTLVPEANQIRLYGPDGAVRTTYDFHPPHGNQPTPHANDWRRGPSGKPQRIHAWRPVRPGELSSSWSPRAAALRNVLGGLMSLLQRSTVVMPVIMVDPCAAGVWSCPPAV